MPTSTLAVKVLPNAPRNAVAGWIGDNVLKVKVHAPALEGRANEELVEFIAEILAVPKRSIEIIRGEKSRQKLLRIHDLDFPEVKNRVDRQTNTLGKRPPS